LKTAERILSEMYRSMPRQELPNCESAAKFAVLVASRRCGEFVELKMLFNSVSEVYELLKHGYLRKLYTPPDKTAQITQHALRIAKCLDKVVVPSEVEERVRALKLDTVSSKPVNIAIVLVYNMLGKRVSVNKLAECANTTVHVVRNAIKRHSRLF
jgi:transcription initiation factor TFIIIB Brf1 subunit/transcription initiation factor TFIIB